MIFEVPIPENTAFFQQRASLDGTDFLLDFSYNQREDAFYLSILEAQGETLIAGVKVVSNYPLLRHRRYVAGLPKGELWALDLQAKKSAPGLGVLGKEIGFYYFDSDEQ